MFVCDFHYARRNNLCMYATLLGRVVCMYGIMCICENVPRSEQNYLLYMFNRLDSVGSYSKVVALRNSALCYSHKTTNSHTRHTRKHERLRLHIEYMCFSPIFPLDAFGSFAILLFIRLFEHRA